MNNDKMFRKAQFFSITVFLFLVVMFLIFSYLSNERQREEDFHMDRLQISTVSNFINAFENSYVPEMLSIAVKPAVRSYLETGNKLDGDILVDLMKDGKYDGKQYFVQTLSTDAVLYPVLRSLTFSEDVRETIDETIIDYEVESVEMKDHSTILITFKVSYSFSSDIAEYDRDWDNDNLIVPIEFDILGLPHLYYSGQEIDEEWDEDSSSCYLQSAFEDGIYSSCSYDLKPPISEIV